MLFRIAISELWGAPWDHIDAAVAATTYAFMENKQKMTCIMRKPTFYICKNKDTDQLSSNRKADQRLCFCYLDSTKPLLP